tara:strand:- start:321 stop:983 length:663 start_codon:yes stop_codon:yes gene_type:complete
MCHKKQKEQKEFNFFLVSEEKTEVFKYTTSFEKYIILQKRQKELVNEVSHLQISNGELEEYNYSMETQKRYTENLLKNFVELDKLLVKVEYESNSYYKNIKTKNIVFKNRLYKNIRIFQFFMSIISCFIFFYEDYGIHMFLNIVNLLCVVSFLESIMIKICKHISIKLVTDTECIKNLNKDIKLVADCYNFIHEHLDNLKLIKKKHLLNINNRVETLYKY